MRSKINFRLCLVTNRNLLPPDTLVDRIARLAECGLRAVQIREKDLSARDVISLAEKVRKRTTAHSLDLFINDRADIARAVRADGLHIPEHGFPVDEARRVVAEKLIGKSAHSLESALKWESEGADFITFGPIYDTPSKREFGKPQGLETLREICFQVKIPVFAIGGMTPERSGYCIDQGAHGIFVMGDLLQSEDPISRFSEYTAILPPA
ncbi:MAG: thiamine phosphate synthase [Bacteroidota bacterium]|nr:thiamine phosphate synthase [Bacteroidota bacterium]MDP4234891.1 thiamine phosphate synthase [Bacteroidota bacterium]